MTSPAKTMGLGALPVWPDWWPAWARGRESVTETEARDWFARFGQSRPPPASRDEFEADLAGRARGARPLQRVLSAGAQALADGLDGLAAQASAAAGRQAVPLTALVLGALALALLASSIDDEEEDDA